MDDSCEWRCGVRGEKPRQTISRIAVERMANMFGRDSGKANAGEFQGQRAKADVIFLFPFSFFPLISPRACGNQPCRF
jgi:hypothetical protein